MKLTGVDYQALERSYISKQIADAAGIYRVASLEGKELMHRSGGGDYSGIVFPYCWPGDHHSVLHRLRLDNPPVGPDGKPQHKYLTAPSERNHLYFPPCDPGLLTNPAIPVVITEGEKKCLALSRMAAESGNGTGTPAFLPIAVSGVWNWKGVIGSQNNARGERVPEKGVLPDFDRIQWRGREVTILFDVNAETNSSVAAARRHLARELASRGAIVRLANLPAVPGVNGCDDFLALHGVERLREVLRQAIPYQWRMDLLVTEKGKPRAVLANAITAFRGAPEWYGVLAWDEFALRVVPLRSAPWGAVTQWTDQEDRRATEWLQRQGILVKLTEAGQGIQTVAQDHSYHPVRDYLDGLKWDGIRRIDSWLTSYAGVKQPEDADAHTKRKFRTLTRAIGARWLISAVARIYKPGCKADCCLILEGPQGIGKSTLLSILGGEWYCDDVADLSTKDAPLGTRGKWILEFSELDAIAKSTPSRIKSFISRAVDHFRLPFDRRANDFPRECVFAGTVNHSAYLRDETGNRRFWPVRCGTIKLDALRRDRDQLWAEAVVRFRRGDKWWLDSPRLIDEAGKEQDQRYDEDPWTAPIVLWLGNRLDTNLSEILTHAICKPTEHWTQLDKTRVAQILVRLRWERYKKRLGTHSEWRYRPAK